MEPAIVLCTGVALFTLGLWATGRLGALILALPDRLASARMAPNRAVATAVLAIVAFVAIPRSPASADPVPPIVRLADRPVEESNRPPSQTRLATAYQVRRGDSLWRIAARTLAGTTGRLPASADVARFWPHIYAANREVIGDDPNLILPGQPLIIPDP